MAELCDVRLVAVVLASRLQRRCNKQVDCGVAEMARMAVVTAGRKKCWREVDVDVPTT